MTLPYIRAQKALELWEDICFVLDQVQRCGGINTRAKSMPPAAAFRPWLLEGQGTFDSLFLYQGEEETMRHIRYLPFLLHSWVTHSKRVFHLGDDACAAVKSVEPKDITWGDIVWPFHSFIVSSDQHGITASSSKETRFFNSFIVYAVPDVIAGEIILAFMLLGTELDSYERLTPAQRQAVHLSCLSGTEYTQQVTEYLASHRLSFGKEIIPFRQPIVQCRHPVGSFLCRLCLALVSSTQRSHPSTETSPPGISRTWQTDPAKLCLVEHEHILRIEPVDMTISTQKRKAYELSPHKRRAHKRRAKGTPLNAPKTIDVPETKVRYDRLQPGQMIDGSVTVIPSHDKKS